MRLSLAAGMSRFLALVLVLSLGARYAAADEGWLVSLEKAKEQAAKEGKDILMEFTGSDWCPPCKAFHKNVLITDVFMTEVPKTYILLKLDNPRDKSNQSEEEQAQYKELSAKMEVRGVPTVMLADATGRPYARKVGYGGTPAEDYVKELGEFAAKREQRDALLSKAEAASGLEKAKLLDQMLDVVGDLALVAYADEANQIVQLDSENEAGLKDKYQGLLNSKKIAKALAEVQRSFRTAGPEATLQKIDEMIGKFKPQGETLQQVLMVKAQLLFGIDKEKSKATLEAAQKLAPESRIGKQIDRILEQAFKSNAPKDDEAKTDKDK